METKIKGRSHYNCSQRPNFMATEHTWDETVLAQMPGHQQWVFLFCPLKFDSTGYEPPVWAHSPVCELLPFTEVVSSGFREQRGVCQPQNLLQSSHPSHLEHCQPWSLGFFRKIKEVLHLTRCQSSAAADSGGCEGGWHSGVVFSLTCTSSTGALQKLAGPWGGLWAVGTGVAGQGLEQWQGPSCTRDKSGEEEGRRASLFQGQKGKRLD